MNKLFSTITWMFGLSMAIFTSNFAMAGVEQESKPKGCIVSLETGAEYCLPVGQRSGYSLPSWIGFVA
ncbi:hypothetical protein AT251_24350 [Enterovibrio nigricans]|uniref:Metalloprotease StcE C-terminal domain-containing protein n=1 Tax=Enterovibrio nigricans DSM 22720 TaxID=1121868 RepID=A0A1T4WEV6_9GAMM|nr:hypothetical protein AT251_24350 [Enterovibrio nigricans]SKA75679.1 hypothetical protein SAMN02745132_04900 [Enterovibrio nigricans DSM 22720]